MPRGDHTGPMGRGPKTGRGFGYCAGYGMPGYASSFSQDGRGAAFANDFGIGRGGYGRRLRRGFNPHRFSGWGQYYDSPDLYDISRDNNVNSDSLHLNRWCSGPKGEIRSAIL